MMDLHDPSPEEHMAANHDDDVPEEVGGLENPFLASTGTTKQIAAQIGREVLQYPGGETSVAQRIYVPAEVYPYRAGFCGGAVAGAAMASAMAAWGLLTGRGVWFPVNLIAATVLPDLQTASPQTLAQFHLTGALVGTLIHFALSIGLGFVFATLLPTLLGSAFLWALLIGPLLWFIAQYLALPLVNPRMETLVHVPSFAIAHVIYSLILGWWVSRTPKIPVS